MPRTWLDAVTEFARPHRVGDGVLSVLQAYGRGGDRACRVPFHDLEASVTSTRDALAQRIATELSTEVDPHQAAMFAQRYRSVDHLLQADGDAESRVLRVGLSERLTQVLDEGGPTRALRVRGLVDFVYSQAALHWHTRSGAPAPDLATWAADAAFAPVQPGLSLARLEGPTTWGPQRVSVLRIEAGSASLDVLDAWSAWGPEQDIAAQVAQTGASAAFSGGFFLYSEPDLSGQCPRHDPVGLVLGSEGLRSPAVFARAALLQDEAGRFQIRTVGPADHTCRIGGGRWFRPTDWTTRAQDERADGVAIVGGRVVAVGSDLQVPLNGLVLRGLDDSVQVGEPVAWRLDGVRAGVSGGPVLVRDGVVGFDLTAEDFTGTAPPRTFVDDETGDRNLLPRLAVGLTPDGDLLVAAVDGRHAEKALGLGLHALGELMHALGAEHAMNLDGGSSKRLIVEGEIVDRPSIGVQGTGVAVEEVRPLHTVVLVRRP